MPNTSFIKRRLQVRLTLAKGSFGSGNTVVIDNHAMRVSVEKLGPPDFAKASVEIFGMNLNDIEQLTSLSFHPFKLTRNYINIFAGDDESGLSQIFAGSITAANGDLSGYPEHKLKIDAEVGFWGRVTAQGPNVINGTQAAASFIETQATKAGMTFSNEGVSDALKNCVFSGSPVEQARQAAKQIGADLLIDDDEMILLPRQGNRKGNAILLNKDSGLLGYPAITSNGIECKSIFNPAFRFAGLFVLESIVPKASGTWRVIKLTHKLSANDPSDGSWESSITGFYPAMSGAVGKLI